MKVHGLLLWSFGIFLLFEMEASLAESSGYHSESSGGAQVSGGSIANDDFFNQGQTRNVGAQPLVIEPINAVTRSPSSSGTSAASSQIAYPLPPGVKGPTPSTVRAYNARKLPSVPLDAPSQNTGAGAQPIENQVTPFSDNPDVVQPAGSLPHIAMLRSKTSLNEKQGKEGEPVCFSIQVQVGAPNVESNLLESIEIGQTCDVFSSGIETRYLEFQAANEEFLNLTVARLKGDYLKSDYLEVEIKTKTVWRRQ